MTFCFPKCLLNKRRGLFHRNKSLLLLKKSLQKTGVVVIKYNKKKIQQSYFRALPLKGSAHSGVRFAPCFAPLRALHAPNAPPPPFNKYLTKSISRKVRKELASAAFRQLRSNFDRASLLAPKAFFYYFFNEILSFLVSFLIQS